MVSVMDTPPDAPRTPLIKGRRSPPRKPEKRTQVCAEIRLHTSGPEMRFVKGTLMDVSPGGFRVRHASRELKPGVVVYAWGIVGARTAWTRIIGTMIESGFALLE